MEVVSLLWVAIISLKEGTIAYNTNAWFRNNLVEGYKEYAVITSQEGLKTSSFHKINPTGTFSNISTDRFDKLDYKAKSYHVAGKGIVKLGGDYGSRWLRVDASTDFSSLLRLAYTKDTTSN